MNHRAVSGAMKLRKMPPLRASWCANAERTLLSPEVSMYTNLDTDQASPGRVGEASSPTSAKKVAMASPLNSGRSGASRLSRALSANATDVARPLHNPQMCISDNHQSRPGSGRSDVSTPGRRPHPLLLKSWKAHKDSVIALTLIPQTDRVVSGSYDKTVRLRTVLSTRIMFDFTVWS